MRSLVGKGMVPMITAAMTVAALLLSACGQESEAQRQSRACGEDADLAYNMTLRYVADELGNPKNADYPYLSEVRVRKPDAEDPCAWLIYGHVDLEEESGSAQHRQYIMTIVYSGSNRWRMTDFRWQPEANRQKALNSD